MEYATCKLKPEEFALRVLALCKMMRAESGETCKLAWEIPGPGQDFGKKITDLGYRNIYWRTDEQKLAAPVKAEKPGWNASNQNKLLLLSDYRSDLANFRFINHSQQALKECLSFEFTKAGPVAHSGEKADDDPTGARENHGDRTIADALCNKMRRAAGIVMVREVPQEEVVNPHSLAFRRDLVEQRARRQEKWE
jgi:hypothetical protein